MERQIKILHIFSPILAVRIHIKETKEVYKSSKSIEIYDILKYTLYQKSIEINMLEIFLN